MTGKNANGQALNQNLHLNVFRSFLDKTTLLNHKNAKNFKFGTLTTNSNQKEFMRKFIFILALLSIGCTVPGPEMLRNCSDKEILQSQIALEIVADYFPESYVVLDDMRFSCKDVNYYEGIECLTMFYPKGPAYPGLTHINKQYIGQCIIHESYHFLTYAKTDGKDVCKKHTEDCWDKYYLEEALDKYKEVKKL